MSVRFVSISKHGFSKEYQRRIEESDQKHKNHITGDGPKTIHYWPIPKRRSDIQELKRKLRERNYGQDPGSTDWGWTQEKLKEAEEALRMSDRKMKPREWLFLGLAVISTAVAVLQLFGVF